MIFLNSECFLNSNLSLRLCIFEVMNVPRLGLIVLLEMRWCYVKCIFAASAFFFRLCSHMHACFVHLFGGPGSYFQLRLVMFFLHVRIVRFLLKSASHPSCRQRGGCHKFWSENFGSKVGCWAQNPHGSRIVKRRNFAPTCRFPRATLIFPALPGAASGQGKKAREALVLFYLW